MRSPEEINSLVMEVAKDSKRTKTIEKLPVTAEELRIECESNTELKELLQDMFDCCFRYTETVLAYREAVLLVGEEGREKLVETDSVRHKVHDATIDSINILARHLTKNEINAKWIKDLSANRAAYGRFALLITFSDVLSKCIE